MIYKLHPLVEPLINLSGTFLGSLLAALIAIVVMKRQINYDKTKVKVNESERFVKEYIELSGLLISLAEILEDLVTNVDKNIENEEYGLIKGNIEVINKRSEELNIVNKEHIPIEIYRDFVGVKLFILYVTGNIEEYVITNKKEFKQEAIKETKRIQHAIEKFRKYGEEKENELIKLKKKLK